MKLFEFEAKQIFAGVGIPVLRGTLAKSPEQVRGIAEQLKGPVVLKPQTLTKARMNRQGVYDAFQIFHKSVDIKVLLVNIFAGLNRCDELAEGIRDYLKAYQPPFPIVVRMIGNREKERRQILEGMGITPIAGVEEAIDRAIALATYG